MAVNSTIFLADTELRVDDTAGSVAERIVRNGSMADEVRVTYGVTGDTAVAGQDFVGGFGTATIPAGAAEVSVPLQLLDDTLAEDTELFVFSLVNVEGGTLWAPRTSRISILDNERPAPQPDPEPPLSSDYDVRQVPVVGGLDEPIRFEFSPVDASRVYVAEKDGIIRVADTASGASSAVLDIRDRVNAHQDRGLLDIALHPEFTTNPYIYAFVVVDPAGAADLAGNAGLDGAGNRYAQVLRFAADPATGYTTVLPGSEAVLAGRAGRSLGDVSGGGREDFTSPDFAGATASDRYIDTGAPPQPVVGGFKQDYIKVDSASHAGGALAFGPDGALFVSTGDGTSFDYADPRTPDVQSLDSLSGKILRIDPVTGQGLVDNPFAGTDVPLDSNRAKVWQYGLRNPFSMAFDGEGRLFVTNTGWNSWEAIDIGGPGANFGWPFFEGGDGGELLETPTYRDFASAGSFYDAVGRGDVEVTPAFRAFSHDSSDAGFQVQAITGGGAIYAGSAYPSAFQNDFFFADFAGREVYTVDVNDRTSLKFLYQGGDAVPVDFVEGPDGYVYYADIVAGEIGRIEITAAAPLPPGGLTD
ncbi:MAG TPA: PQQ-dependent sugar dehydrogenase, partial [Thermomicrobiales bacterium]|nr:PQQ-dependent sugar dehydrogenase [Thermomicrobiales bacterium]